MTAIATRIGWIVIASGHLETVLGYTHQRVVGSKGGREMGALGDDWGKVFADVVKSLTQRAESASSRQLVAAVKRAGDDWKRRNDVIHAHWWEIDPSGGTVHTSRFRRDGNHSTIPWDIDSLMRLYKSLRADTEDILGAIRALDVEEAE